MRSPAGGGRRVCSAGLGAAVGKVRAVELSGRFYTRKRRPVGSEVRGPTGEGGEEEEDRHKRH